MPKLLSLLASAALLPSALWSQILEGNFLSNSRFGKGSSLNQPTRGVFEGWERGGTNPSICQVSEENQVSGDYAMALVDQTTSTWGEWRRGIELPAEILPGDVLDVRWHEFYQVNGVMGLKFTFRDADGFIALVQQFLMTGASEGWSGAVTTSRFTRRDETLRPPPGAERLEISFHSGVSTSVRGLAFIDDLSIRVQPADDPDLDVPGGELGVVALGSVDSALPLAIRNAGRAEDLALDSVEIRGPAADFVSVASFPPSLTSQTAGEISLRVLRAPVLGAVEGIAVIASNDESEPEIEIPFRYRVTHGSGLLAHYPLDEEGGMIVRDDSGNGYHGQFSAADGGSFTLGEPALAGAGGSVRLAGDATASLQVQGLPPLRTFSLGLWLRRAGADAGSRSTLFSRGESGNVFHLLLSDGSSGEVVWTVGGGFTDFRSPPVVEAGMARHLMFARRAGAEGGSAAIAVYLDGALVARNEVSAGYEDDGTGLFEIGARGAMDGFTGWIDDVQIYERFLEEEDVVRLFRTPGQTLSSGPTVAVDSDGDGYSDAAETAMGTDPRDPRSFLVLTPEAGAGAPLLRWPSVPGIRYRLEYAAALAGPWQALPAAEAVEGTGEILEVGDSAEVAERYYRLTVVP